ncbi:ArsR/SmtB family transcription factor [Archangium lansingense]|uniref:ArsR/SmtB family transcription factor n=1 Tax=Archangium lansingense TaxID=2995310 RepID=UPI003B7C32BD
MRTRQRAIQDIMEVLDSDFLRALTERARLEILRVLLLHGASDVTSIASHLPQERSVISRHLKVLEDAGIVRVTPQGRQRIYSLDPMKFLATLEAITARVRAAVPDCCPLPPEPPPPPRVESRNKPRPR